MPKRNSSQKKKLAETSRPLSQATEVLPPKPPGPVDGNAEITTASESGSSAPAINPPTRAAAPRPIITQSHRGVVPRTSLHSGVLRSPKFASPRSSIIATATVSGSERALLRSPTPSGIRLPPVAVPHATSAARRPIFTPQRAQRLVSVEVPVVPVTPLIRKTTSHSRLNADCHSDAMRVPIAKTPFTAKRTIESYKSERDPIKTFLRLKPRFDDQGELVSDNDVPDNLEVNSEHNTKGIRYIQVVSDKEVEICQTVNSKDHHHHQLPSSQQLRGERYLFTGILGEKATQGDTFRTCAAPVIRDLFAGYNTLLFTYGVTNSGKTHSIQGDSINPGILPRALQAIFKYVNIKGGQGDFPIRPKYATQVEWCSDPRVNSPYMRMATNEQVWINSLAEGADADLSAIISEEGAHKALNNSAEACDKEDDFVYQLYASYIEVYNEMIHDLLDYSTLLTSPSAEVSADEPSSSAKRSATSVSTRNNNAGNRGRGRGRGRGKGRGRSKNRSRTSTMGSGQNPQLMNPSAIAALEHKSLVLRSEGGRGTDTFVDSVTEVRIRTLQDAIRVLMHGQMRRSVHATGMNNTSSRSHALFTIKVVRIRREAVIEPNMPIPKDASVSVRMLTMVDLAGSERAKRTQNRGDRLAEASKINTSLMTLKKCLDIKRYNTQLTDDELSYDMLQIVPYNESKLTRLFQPALEGGARTVMLVCVDPWDSPENPTTESKNVLDFARVASSIIVRVRKPSSPPPPMLPTTSTHSLPAGDISATTVDSARDGGGSDHQEGEIEGATKLLPKRAYAAESDSDASYGSDPGSDSNINSSSKKNKKKKTRLTLEGTWNYTNGSPPSQASPPSLSPPPSPSKVDSGVSDPGKESPERIVKPNPHVPGRLSGVFGFRERSDTSTPIKLRQSVFSAQQKALEEKDTEISRLRDKLKECQDRTDHLEKERETELQSLTTYIIELKSAFEDIKKKYIDEQVRSVRIEADTRKQLSKFYLAKIAELKANAESRLHEEQVWSETKSARKIDLLSRLKSPSRQNNVASTLALRQDSVNSDLSHAGNYDSDSYATQRGYGNDSLGITPSSSIEPGRGAEAVQDFTPARLHAELTTMRAQYKYLQEQLDISEKTRKRVTESLERVQARLESAQAEAQAMRNERLELARREIEERDKHWSVQVESLKEVLGRMERESRESRRQWEVRELLPLRTQLEQFKKDPENAHQRIEQLTRERDQAWLLLDKQESEAAALREQNNLLLKEIAALHERLSDTVIESYGQIGVAAAAAGGNSDGLTGKIRRKMSRRNLAGRAGALGISVSNDSQGTPERAQREKQSRAHRVVSRVLSHFTPDVRKVQQSAGGRGNGKELLWAKSYHPGETASPAKKDDEYEAQLVYLDDCNSTPGSPRVRSVVYSGPVVPSLTGGHRVTFTSEQVKSVPLSPSVSAALMNDRMQQTMSPTNPQCKAERDTHAGPPNHASVQPMSTPTRGEKSPAGPLDSPAQTFSTPDEALTAYSEGKLLNSMAKHPETPSPEERKNGEEEQKEQQSRRQVSRRKAAQAAKAKLEEQAHPHGRPTRAAAQAASDALAKAARRKKDDSGDGDEPTGEKTHSQKRRSLTQNPDESDPESAAEDAGEDEDEDEEVAEDPSGSDNDSGSAYNSEDGQDGDGSESERENVTPRRAGSRQLSKSPPGTVISQPSVLRRTPGSRKRRKLRQGQTVLNISPVSDQDFDILDASEVPDNDTLMSMPGALGPQLRYVGSKSHLMSPLRSNAALSYSVLSPLKTRGQRRRGADTAAGPLSAQDSGLLEAAVPPDVPANPNEGSILMTPFKMLSRLRSRR